MPNRIKYTSLFILFFVATSINQLAYASESTNFIHLTANIGREESMATNMVEGSQGYLWLESHAGLLRFDGYDYVQYANTDIFGNKVTSSPLLGITKDVQGQVWCVSKRGAVSKLLSSGKFNLQYPDINNLGENQELESMFMGKSHLWLGSSSGTLMGQHLTDSTLVYFDIHSSEERIMSITNGGTDQIWFSTSKGRVFEANLGTNDITELHLPQTNPFNTVFLTSDLNGDLWIGTELFGFFHYDSQTASFEQFHSKASSPNTIPSNMIICLFHDSKGIIWLGTDGGGLYRVNPQNKELKFFSHSKTNQFSLKSNTILGISETNDNDIWVFTNYGNINILPGESTTIGYHSGSISGSPNRALSLMKTHDKTLWIGTDGEGITVVDEKGKPTRQYVANSQTANGLPGNYIQSMVEDENNNIWIGTYLNGLTLHNHKTNTFIPIRATNNSGQTATDIRSLFVDHKHRIWIGSNIGIFVYSTSGEQLQFFNYIQNGLKGSIVEVFIEDGQSDLWIGTNNGGIALFHEAKKLKNSTFTTYQLTDSNSKTGNGVNHGVADKQGHLYLVNSNSELIKFDIAQKKSIAIQGFTQEQLQQVIGVTITDSSNLWISKSSAISHLDLTNNKNFLYTWKNGTIKGNFLSGCVFNDHNKTLYFGGVGGVNFFDPDQMKTTQKQYQLRINKFEIINRNAEKIIPKQLTSGIENVSSLKLNHKQTSFSFHFSVIDDHISPNYFYAYRLKGFDKDWITNENRRTATYTNIPYGDYIFEVKAGSDRNSWDIAPREIQLTILSPLWYRWWAITLYIIFLLAIGSIIIRYYIIWAQLKKKLMLEEWQNEKNNELYALKMNFFAKMSHEIQTPLTLILSPIENMIERAEGDLLLTQRLQVLKNNAKRLSRIALELVTVRNKELDRLKISVSKNDIAEDIDTIALSFRDQARFKNIDFIIERTSNKQLLVWYDKEKLEHVIYNLLANAFKFTPREGKIVLKIETNEVDNTVKLIVLDTGIGIPKEDLKDIFNLFYQSKDGKAIGGTGIGLALSSELISLHKGKIDVSSEINNGTTFIITLPLGKEHFTNEEIKQVQLISEEKEELKNHQLTNDEIQPEPIKDKNKKNILLVEDNYEMLLFLQDSFKPYYNVRTAQNGNEALESIATSSPEIIISDVMMPLMDGIMLCKKLKENRNTRHIPVILLTTKNTTSSKLEGLRFGAIEYISKPFNIRELLLKTNNILESHQRILEQYRAEILTDGKEMEVESTDKKFIESIIAELENNFEDPEFRMEELTTTLNMSYSNIYRKFQSLTGKTLVDFVRSFRLRKAIQLLEKHDIPIKEIAFRVGFNDPKYFSKCFKKEYQKTPKQYKLDAESNQNDNRV